MRGGPRRSDETALNQAGATRIEKGYMWGYICQSYI